MATLHDVLLHNWVSLPSMETAWLTEVLKAPYNVSEQRVALLNKPSRLLSLAWTSTSLAQAAQLTKLLGRAANESVYLPIGQDVVKVTADSSGTTINCVPTNRRFESGKPAVIYKIIEGFPAQAEVVTINTVTATTLTTTGALSQTFPEGSEVAPLIEAEAVLSPELVSLQTSHVYQAQLSFLEIRGATALSALVAAEDAAGFPTAADPNGSGTYPILSLDPDWSAVSLGWSRDGNIESLGLGRVTTLDGSRPKFTLKASWMETDRASAWSLLKLFDSRRGRLLPFWVIHPSDYWNVLAVGATFIDISPQGNFSDLDFLFDHVGIVQTDGTRLVRNISSVVDNTSSWRINLSASISLTLGQVSRAGPAFFMRFTQDAVLESWATDEICSMELEMVEVLNEESVTITNITNYLP